MQTPPKRRSFEENVLQYNKDSIQQAASLLKKIKLTDGPSESKKFHFGEGLKMSDFTIDAPKTERASSNKENVFSFMNMKVTEEKKELNQIIKEKKIVCITKQKYVSQN